MKIALIGYGKMGKTIEKSALEKGHEIVFKANSNSPLTEEYASMADVGIEFSTPDAAVENLFQCAQFNLPVVTGTTGWYHRLNEIENDFLQKKGKILYSSNFSIGVNIFFKLNEHLAAIMNRYESYSPVIHEIHHTEKLDSPSGTAITLAEDIIFHLKRKSEWANDVTREKDVLEIKSDRLPNVPGTHEIIYSGTNDELSIKHKAKDRNGFALGSILAADWLLKKEAGVYSMRDFLKIK